MFFSKHLMLLNAFYFKILNVFYNIKTFFNIFINIKKLELTKLSL